MFNPHTSYPEEGLYILNIEQESLLNSISNNNYTDH